MFIAALVLILIAVNLSAPATIGILQIIGFSLALAGSIISVFQAFFRQQNEAEKKELLEKVKKREEYFFQTSHNVMADEANAVLSEIPKKSDLFTPFNNHTVNITTQIESVSTISKIQKESDHKISIETPTPYSLSIVVDMLKKTYQKTHENNLDSLCVSGNITPTEQQWLNEIEEKVKKESPNFKFTYSSSFFGNGKEDPNMSENLLPKENTLPYHGH